MLLRHRGYRVRHIVTARNSVFMVQTYTGLPDHLTPVDEAPDGALMTLLDVPGWSRLAECSRPPPWTFTA